MFELSRSVFSICFRELIEIPNILLTSASDNLCLIRTAASREIRCPRFSDKSDHISFLGYFNQRVTLPPLPSTSTTPVVFPGPGSSINRFALLLQHIPRGVQAALQSPGEGFQRGVEAVGKHLGAGDMAFFNVEMQFHAALAKAFIQRCENAGA